MNWCECCVSYECKDCCHNPNLVDRFKAAEKKSIARVDVDDMSLVWEKLNMLPWRRIKFSEHNKKKHDYHTPVGKHLVHFYKNKLSQATFTTGDITVRLKFLSNTYVIEYCGNSAMLKDILKILE